MKLVEKFLNFIHFHHVAATAGKKRMTRHLFFVCLFFSAFVCVHCSLGKKSDRTL